MKIEIDLQLCQGHGVCAEEAPEAFRVVEEPGWYDRAELIIAEPDEALRYCPNRVLSIQD